MKIELIILNTENTKSDTENNEDRPSCGWYSRRKLYESDTLDEDMINCTTGIKVDRITLNDIQLTSKETTMGLIIFLKKSLDALEY